MRANPKNPISINNKLPLSLIKVLTNNNLQNIITLFFSDDLSSVSPTLLTSYPDLSVNSLSNGLGWPRNRRNKGDLNSFPLLLLFPSLPLEKLNTPSQLARELRSIGF